ncbi:hypothetical protein D3C87_1880540 [compost metagenome]
MPPQRHRCDAGQHLPALKSAQHGAVAVERLTRHQEVATGALGRAAQIPVILPERDFPMVSDKLGVREDDCSRSSHQPPDMIRMGVRQQDRIDLGRMDARKQKIGF